jgi:broad specificity phosphatase PhoE
MRTLEVRRHTMRTQPGEHLSQAGVDLARRIGDEIGPFDRVITSTIPRAFETAIAMGFAVDEQREELSVLHLGGEINWTDSFAEFARVFALGGVAAGSARALAAFLREVAEALPAGGSALLITHGGILEAGAVACLPEADHAGWGPGFSYCEGVRLHFDVERFSGGEILRVAPDPA